MRTANSRERPAVRASSRFDRLAQAITSTRPTAHQRTTSARRIGPPICVFRSVRTAPNRPQSLCSSRIRGMSVSNSARAEASVTPGLSRPTIESVFPQLRMSSSRAGRSRSTWTPGVNVDEKSKSAGRTPAIVYGSSLMVTARPTTAGSPPKRCCQVAKVRIAARGPLVCHSSWTKSRPMLGRMPSSSRNRGATSTPTRRSGSPRPDSTYEPYPKNAKYAVSDSNERFPRAISSYTATRCVRPLRPVVPVLAIQTRRSASRNGSGRSSSGFTTLNTAVLAPIPSASIRMATIACPGSRAMLRTA